MRKISILSLILLLSVLSCGSDSAKTDYDVIVIGSGGGGLAAAARIALGGKKVAVIEQHSKVGGYMGSFQRGDYRFEISLHALDDIDHENGSWNPMFKGLGIYDKVKPVRMDPMYRMFYPGFQMDVPADAQLYKEILIKQFPNEKEGIENFYADMDSMHNLMVGGKKLLFGNYLSGLAQVMSSPSGIYNIMSCFGKSMTDFLYEYFKDENLIAVMTAYTNMLGKDPSKIGGMIFVGMWDSFHKSGCYYPVGGSESIAEGLADVIKNNKGDIILSSRVTKIIVEDGKATGVQTKDGKTYTSKFVISNANAIDTMFQLVGKQNLPKDYIEKMEKMEIGASTFTVYMGVKKDYNSYFPGESHMIIVMPGLNINKDSKPMSEADADTVYMGITNYTKVDPTNAPKGKNVIGLVSIMTYDMNNGWKENESNEAYQKFKKQVADKFIKRAEKYLPDLSKNIEELEIATPRTNVHYTSNTEGSIYGWAHSEEQSLMNRLPQETPIENLFLSGAWAFPGGGQSMVLLSGYMAGGKVLDELD